MEFLFPAAFLSGIALPLLVGIYFLRRKFKRRAVSALFLWKDHLQELQKGTHVETFKPSVLFFLEFFALLFLVFAAVKPVWTSLQKGRELIVVLDASYSMNGGESKSFKESGKIFLREELENRWGFPITLIRAGKIPEVMGRALQDKKDIELALEKWNCTGDQGDLERALSFAADIGRGRGDVLVISDTPPASTTYLPPGTLWKSFGQPLPNIAFTKAFRIPRKGFDLVQFEIENFSRKAQEIEVFVRGGPKNAVISQERISLSSRGFRRFSIKVDPALSSLTASFDADQFTIDNTVCLVKNEEPLAKVVLDIDNPDLASFLEKGIQATGLGKIVNREGDIYFCEGEKNMKSRPGWSVRIFPGKTSQPYMGPFIFDHSHPLTEGLSFNGVLWGTDALANVSGVPIVTAGNMVLVSQEIAGKNHIINMFFDQSKSTLQYSPDWPILFWNLLNWRQSAFPGFEEENIRLGQLGKYRQEKIEETISIKGPDSQIRQISAVEGLSEFQPWSVGFFAVIDPNGEKILAVNALNPTESNLLSHEAGEWGRWGQVEDAVVSSARSISWLLILFAFGLLAAHQVLLTQGREGVTA